MDATKCHALEPQVCAGEFGRKVAISTLLKRVAPMTIANGCLTIYCVIAYAGFCDLVGGAALLVYPEKHGDGFQLQAV